MDVHLCIYLKKGKRLIRVALLMSACNTGCGVTVSVGEDPFPLLFGDIPVEEQSSMT